MDRRKFFKLTAAGSVIGASTTTTGVGQEAEPQKQSTLAVGPPTVMAPRTDGVEIVWRINSLAKGYVEYGATEKLGSVARNDGWGLRPAGKEVIRVRLDGLEEGATYHYRVITEGFDQKAPIVETGKLRSFRTLSASADNTSFCVWNDTHKNNDTIQKLASITPPGDFLLWNGDVSNDWYREGEVAEALLTPGGAESGVDFTAKSPLLLLRGNHDVRGTLAYQVEDYTATPSGKPWYAFRSGPVAVICMDTGEDKPDDHPYLFGRVACEPMRKEEAEWLEKTIEQSEIKNAPYRIVFCHIPLRWSDETTQHGYDHFSKRSRELWHDSLVKWGAQVIISGHTHRDAYIEANEAFPYAQLVGGGPKMPQARLITGRADSKQLVFNMIDMEGKETRSHSFPSLS
ncbi:MAG: 3',5'-cyclic AMP phosphodiesterase CpdA [Verrucomicrobiales bacterium]|jgi:3',5'-cyclic AMP phosphodiesterase CpdA